MHLRISRGASQRVNVSFGHIRNRRHHKVSRADRETHVSTRGHRHRLRHCSSSRRQSTEHADNQLQQSVDQVHPGVVSAETGEDYYNDSSYNQPANNTGYKRGRCFDRHRSADHQQGIDNHCTRVYANRYRSQNYLQLNVMQPACCAVCFRVNDGTAVCYCNDGPFCVVCKGRDHYLEACDFCNSTSLPNHY